ncbi:MAG: methyltransferase domain-containing protein, partial [Candidatus Xenobia bacterium]
MNGFSALRCEAGDLIFKDKTFDVVFAFSVFQYFPDLDYARRAIAEMTRVARRTVCISDLAAKSHDSNHLLFEESFFSGWEISEAFYP